MRFPILFLFSCFFISLNGYCQDGSLDLSFGMGGKVLTDFNAGPDQGNAISIQPDGKIVVAGYAYLGVNGYAFAIARYKINGELDSTFGTNGKMTQIFPGENAFGTCMVLQRDGKIVVGGYVQNFSQYDFALARFLPDGQPDFSFGNMGNVTDHFGSSNDQVFAIALQADGRILAVGNTTDVGIIHTFALAQYESNGAPDNTFGNAGKVTTGFDGGLAYGRSVVVQTDGKFIVGGYAYNDADFDYDFAAARYQSNGNLDSGFAVNGKLTTNFGRSDEVNSIALQSDGKFILAGSSFNNSGQSHVCFSRYEINGDLDVTFGVNGQVTINSALYAAATAIVIRPDGKINIGGSGGAGFLVSQYMSDGTPDLTFGTAGITLTGFGSDYDYAYSMALQQDGKIILAGIGDTVLNVADKFALARYNGGTTLPVNLTGFSCTGLQNSIMLTWATAREINNSFYSIERSNNGLDFTLVYTVKSNGSANSNGAYIYEDLTPFEGYNYYRLKMVDIDGGFKYSGIIKSKFSKHKKISIFPNPVQAILNITGTDAGNKNFIIITNSSGMVIYKGAATRNLISIDIHKYPAGMYQIKVSDTTGSITTLSFIKK